MFSRDTSAGRTTGLSCLKLLTVRDAATDIFNNRTKGGTHRDFYKTGVLNLTAESEYLGTLTLLGTHGSKPIGTV